MQHSTFVKLLCSQKVKLSERVLISFLVLLVVTLYEPRCWTWHERTASRPATTVRLSTSSVNSGSWSSDTPTDNIDIQYLHYIAVVSLCFSSVHVQPVHYMSCHTNSPSTSGISFFILWYCRLTAPPGKVRCLDSRGCE